MDVPNLFCLGGGFLGVACFLCNDGDVVEHVVLASVLFNFPFCSVLCSTFPLLGRESTLPWVGECEKRWGCHLQTETRDSE